MSLPPHLAQVEIARREPDADFDAEKAHEILVERFARVAERIVAKGLLHKTPTQKEVKLTASRIRKQIEFEARIKSVQFFLDLWNEWREFYFDLPPMTLKNAGQITTVENCIVHAKRHGLHLGMLLGCIHRAYVGRKIRPHFNVILTHGEEIYEEQYDKLEADISERSYLESSMRRGYVSQA